MSERETVQGKIGRSGTTNQLDERIDPYQGIGWTSRSHGRGLMDGFKSCVRMSNTLSATRDRRKSHKVPTINMVEAAGVEPASEIDDNRETPCSVRSVVSLPALRADKKRRKLVR
jgi:hypothetical protein